MKRKHALVLGGTGYIGSEIVAVLMNDPRYRVSVLAHNNIPFHKLEKTNIIEGSLERFDLDFFKRDPVDVIFHCARIPGRRRLKAFGRKQAALRGKKANERLIAFLRELPAPPQVVYVSGSLAYGHCEDELVTESMPLNPIAFAREYSIAETPWIREVEAGYVPTCMVRPPWIFGNSSWFKAFYLQHLKLHGTVPQYGVGNNWMTLLHVKDCAKLVAEHADKQPGSYNIFMDEYVTHREFAERLAKKLGVRVQPYSDADVLGKMGKTLFEALTFSCKLASDHPTNFELNYPYLGALLDEASHFLENE